MAYSLKEGLQQGQGMEAEFCFIKYSGGFVKLVWCKFMLKLVEGIYFLRMATEQQPPGMYFSTLDQSNYHTGPPTQVLSSLLHCMLILHKSSSIQSRHNTLAYSTNHQVWNYRSQHFNLTIRQEHNIQLWHWHQHGIKTCLIIMDEQSNEQDQRNGKYFKQSSITAKQLDEQCQRSAG